MYRQNDLQPISKKETKLAQLLSDTIEEEGGPDALFVVIKTLVCAPATDKPSSNRDDNICLILGYYSE